MAARTHTPVQKKAFLLIACLVVLALFANASPGSQNDGIQKRRNLHARADETSSPSDENNGKDDNGETPTTSASKGSKQDSSSDKDKNTDNDTPNTTTSVSKNNKQSSSSSSEKNSDKSDNNKSKTGNNNADKNDNDNEDNEADNEDTEFEQSGNPFESGPAPPFDLLTPTYYVDYEGDGKASSCFGTPLSWVVPATLAALSLSVVDLY